MNSSSVTEVTRTNEKSPITRRKSRSRASLPYLSLTCSRCYKGSSGLSSVTHLYGLHQVGSAVGDLFGGLDKVPLGHGVARLG